MLQYRDLETTRENFQIFRIRRAGVFCFCFLVTIVAYAVPVRVTASMTNQDGSLVLVETCNGPVYRLLACNSDQPDCKVISAGPHDLAYLQKWDKRAIYNGQNIIVDDSVVFQLRATQEDKYLCSAKK
jgi:hypothetical protein